VHLSRKIDDTREIQSDIFAFTVLEARRQISDKNKTGLNILKLGNKTKEKTITTLYVEQVTYYLPAWPRAKNELRLASLWRTTRDEGGALWRDKDGRKKKQQHRLSGVTSEQHQERLKTKGVREGVKVATIRTRCLTGSRGSGTPEGGKTGFLAVKFPKVGGGIVTLARGGKWNFVYTVRKNIKQNNVKKL